MRVTLEDWTRLIYTVLEQTLAEPRLPDPTAHRLMQTAVRLSQNMPYVRELVVTGFVMFEAIMRRDHGTRSRGSSVDEGSGWRAGCQP